MNRRQQPVVAIDGPVGVGKSTVASQVAERLGFIYIDTGAMYRAITLKAARVGLDPEDELSLVNLALQTMLHFERSDRGLRIFCDAEDVSEAIRSPEISAGVAPIADNPGIRSRLVALQQELGKDGGVVMEGRDIGTVVFPDAEMKFYLDADPKIRAQRRYEELIEKGKKVTYEDTLRDLLERDHRDRTRSVGALRIAEDAQVIDTTHLTQTQVIDQLVEIVRSY